MFVNNAWTTVLALLLLLYTKKSACGGDLSLQLIHFENPQSKLDNGKCCDDLGEICSQCEYRFTFCLSRLTTDNCTFKRISTPVLTSDEYYIFQSRFKSVKPSEIITNPMIIPVERWDGSLSISITVYDVDAADVPTGRDLVSLMEKNVSLLATRHGTAASSQFLVMRGRQRAPGVFPKLSLELSIRCAKNYLVPGCSDHCIDRNDAFGHYSCNYVTGMRDCHLGWYGRRCDKYCMPSDDPLGHFTCDISSGDKECLPGWIDASTNCTRENGTAESYKVSLMAASIPWPSTAIRARVSSAVKPTSLMEKSHGILHATQSSDLRSIASRGTVSLAKYKTHVNDWKLQTSSRLAQKISEMRTVIAGGPSTYSVISRESVVTSTNARRSFSRSDLVDAWTASTTKSDQSSAYASSLYMVTKSWTNDSQTQTHTLQERISRSDVLKKTEMTSNIFESKLRSTKPLLNWSHRVSLSDMTVASSHILLRTKHVAVENTESTRVKSLYLESQIVHSLGKSKRTCTMNRLNASCPSRNLEITQTIVSIERSSPSTALTVTPALNVTMQAKKQSLLRSTAFSRFLQQYKIYLVSAGGFSVLLLAVAFACVTRKKRSNRVQALRQERPQINQNPQISRDSLEQEDTSGRSSYPLLYQSINADIDETVYRPPKPMRSNQLKCSVEDEAISSSSSLSAVIVPCDESASRGGRTKAEHGSDMEYWTRVKCWTPSDAGAQSPKSWAHNDSEIRRNCWTPTQCPVKLECPMTLPCPSPSGVHRLDGSYHGNGEDAMGKSSRTSLTIANTVLNRNRLDSDSYSTHTFTNQATDIEGNLVDAAKLRRGCWTDASKVATNHSSGSGCRTPVSLSQSFQYQSFTRNLTPSGFPTIELTETKLWENATMDQNRPSSITRRQSNDTANVYNCKIDSQISFQNQTSSNFLVPPKIFYSQPPRTSLKSRLSQSSELEDQRRDSFHFLVPNDGYTVPGTPCTNA